MGIKTRRKCITTNSKLCMLVINSNFFFFLFIFKTLKFKCTIRLSNLVRLSLSFNQLTSIPSQLNQLACLRFLDLSNNQISSFEESQFSGLLLLSSLNLSHNLLQTLPNSEDRGILHLTNLKALYLHSNQLTWIPTKWWKLKGLWELTLDHNQLQSPLFADSLEREKDFCIFLQLKKLTLDNNQLSSVPSFFIPFLKQQESEEHQIKLVYNLNYFHCNV